MEEGGIVGMKSTGWLKNTRECALEAMAYSQLAKFVDISIHSVSSKQLNGVSEEPSSPAPVWQLWTQGERSVPSIVRKSMLSVDNFFPEGSVKRLDLDSVSNYLDVPGHVFDKLKSSVISQAQFSDIVRCGLLAEHGGTWLDSTVFLTGNPMKLLRKDSSFFAFGGTPAIMGGSPYIKYSSWFLWAKSGSRTFSVLYDALCRYWKSEKKLRHYYQFHFMLTYLSEVDLYAIDEQAEAEYVSNVPPHYLQFALADKFDQHRMNYFTSATSVHKLSHYGEFMETSTPPVGTFYEKLFKS